MLRLIAGYLGHRHQDDGSDFVVRQITLLLRTQTWQVLPYEDLRMVTKLLREEHDRHESEGRYIMLISYGLPM